MSKDWAGASFGRMLRRHREARGLTLDDVATLSGLTPNYIALVERGRCDPSLSTLFAIMIGLDLEFPATAEALSWAAEEAAQLFDTPRRSAQAVTLMAAGDDARGAPPGTILPLALGLGVKASELPRPYDGLTPTDDDKHAQGGDAVTRRRT
jgi:transcriptional regulator with XRE-family HTH domain